MVHFAYLRALALALLVVSTTGCNQREDDPQPTTRVPVPNEAKYHPVSLRYYVKPVGRSFALPKPLPNITVEYERVTGGSSQSYGLLAPSPQFHDQEVTSVVKEVALPPIPTYAKSGAVQPKITVSAWVDEAPLAGSEGDYEVISELLIDGKLADTNTLKVVSGQNTPLYTIAQTQVAY
ncbi:hypothetical protein [Hymenobacter sp. GOD-10R]|uniref:hypothetical protein n=1 Tax=Hymenobacter sp. GOD-10R TaxID=3093922 RepID=UPI002D7A1FA5|nr:hypothetical protein [Hymenobacter sp. GOD-10R]WRQ26584.1 hypothetical protein SD425_16045 [Hymenobacter sp. GOD-10R]